MQRSSTEQDGKVSEVVAVADCKVRCAGFGVCFTTLCGPLSWKQKWFWLFITILCELKASLYSVRVMYCG